MKKNIKKNYIYNLSYQLFLMIVPLLVTPYIARVIGSEGSGKYSFSSSIIIYFLLVAGLGFNTYGQRVIASNQENIKQQSKDFWEIVIARFLPISISVFSLVICVVFNLFGDYTLLFAIQIISVIAVFFDITFLFQGNEEFGRIVFRSLIIKVASIASIFLFVKNEGDLNIYVIIQCLTVLISQLSLWFYLPKQVVKVKIQELEIFKHYKPTLILFLPTIATSIYLSLDKSLIGFITGNDSETGNYEYAERLVKMCITIFTSLGAVMIPRNAKMFANGRIDDLKQNINSTCRFVLIAGIPMMFGVLCVAHNVIPWYLGEGYDKVANIMLILSPVIVVIGISNIIGLQYLIPCSKDKQYTIAIICGTITNVILNIILIRNIASYGAALGTVFAELVVLVVMIFFTKKEIDYFQIIKDGYKYLIAGIFMFIPCLYVSSLLDSSILNTCLIACIGATLYLISLLVLRDKLLLDCLGKILRKRNVKL